MIEWFMTTYSIIAIENQTEIVLQNASPQLLEKIHGLVKSTTETEVVRSENSRTTLERLFLKETSGKSEDERSDI